MKREALVLASFMSELGCARILRLMDKICITHYKEYTTTPIV